MKVPGVILVCAVVFGVACCSGTKTQPGGDETSADLTGAQDLTGTGDGQVADDLPGEPDTVDTVDTVETFVPPDVPEPLDQVAEVGEVTACGNGVCENGEDEQSCPADCVEENECAVFDGDCDAAIPPEPWWYFDGYQCLMETTCTCEGCPGTFASKQECEQQCGVPTCAVFDGDCTTEIPEKPWWYFDGSKCIMNDSCTCENCPGTYESKFECDTACFAAQCIKWDGACADAEPDQPWWYFDGTECKEEANCSCDNCPGVFLTEAQCEATCLPQPECAIWDESCVDVDVAPWWYFDGVECKLQDSCDPDPTQKYVSQDECEAACIDLPCKVWQGGCVAPEPDGEWWYFDGSTCQQGTCGCSECPATYLTEAQCKVSCGL